MLMACKNDLIQEMLENQRTLIVDEYRLERSDICRLCKYINSSIFTVDECVIWSGYYTNSNKGKSQYVNFYLKGKKLALHRILYVNFIDELQKSQYIKYSCDNPGKCCNINHIYKVVDEEEVATTVTVPDKSEKISDVDSIRSSLSRIFND